MIFADGAHVSSAILSIIPRFHVQRGGLVVVVSPSVCHAAGLFAAVSGRALVINDLSSVVSAGTTYGYSGLVCGDHKLTTTLSIIPMGSRAGCPGRRQLLHLSVPSHDCLIQAPAGS